MSTDFDNEVRRTFSAVADGVESPPIDHLAFHGKVRAARGRRAASRTGLVLGGTGAVAAGVTGVLLATSLFTGSGTPDAGPTTSGPPVFVPAGDTTPPIVFALQDEIDALLPGSWGAQGLQLGRSGAEDLFRTAEGVALIDGQSGLVRVAIEVDGSGPSFGEPQRSENPIDNIAVSLDGRTGAWFELDGDDVNFVTYDFEHGERLAEFPVQPGGGAHSIVAVDGDRTIVQEGHTYSLWSATQSAVELDLGGADYWMRASWSSGVLAMTRADGSGADLFRVRGGEASLMGSVPSLGLQVSPVGDNAVGFTEAAEEPALADDKDPVALWSTSSLERTDFEGMPNNVYQVGWLDNDTVVVTGSQGAMTGTWPGALDIYTCELGDLTCAKVYDDPTGDQDRFPLIAGAIAR